MRITAHSFGLFVFILFLLGLAVLPGCKDDVITGPGGSPSDVIFPDSLVSYRDHVQVLFNQTCALATCHEGSTPAGDLNLTSYSNTMFGVNGAPIVFVGNPDASPLVMRIQGTAGVRMPLNRNPLNENQINGIRKWILEGAQDN